MIKNFSQYLVEEQREIFFTFGRMNPPTIGHGKVMDVLASKSGKADYKVFISQTQDKKKNPLSYNDKVKHARKMFPKHARSIIVNKKVKTPIDALVALYDQGYKNVTMVVGSDRVTQFSTLFDQYNGVKARHGFYNFQTLRVVSAGERDPDADGIEGMSASKQRNNAKENDFVSFSQGVPKAMSNSDARKLFNDVRTGMGLKEEKEFKNHISLQPVSEAREKFVQGELFEVGDLVVIKESGDITEVTHLGANYVITETNGVKTRRWLDSVELLPIDESLRKSIASVSSKFPEKSKAKYKGKTVDVLGNGKDFITIGIGNRTKQVSPSELTPIKETTKVSQDPDIKDKEGTQPAKYHKGLEKSTKDKRDAHFKKNAKKADDDDSAYKPAPGDASAKTKPSKFTKAFKDMYDEDCWDGYKQVGMKKKGKKMVPNCVAEEGGAGEEGTDKLKKKYEKDTPFMKIDEASWAQDFGRFASKTVKKNKYQKLAKIALDKIKKNGQEGKHSLEYWASEIIRVNNISGINSKALADVMRNIK